MAITVRAASADDLPAIKAMVQEFIEFLNTLDEPGDVGVEMLDRLDDLAFGPEPLCTVLLAECEGRLAGYLVYFLGVHMDRVVASLHVADLFVREPDRRRGVGRALMAAARDAARGHGCGVMVWTVWRKNPVAMRFYERLGATFVNEERLMAWPVDDG